MHHEASLISTIAIGLTYAAVGGYIALKLRLPPLVGYLVAGIVVGPFTPGFVADAKLAQQLAEIGIIFLMFGVGMHFSIRDLLAVRKLAIPGALVQIAAAVALSCGVTYFWGWKLGPGIVFGLAMSVASTVVLLRALEAEGILQSLVGRTAIGWLIVEDLVTVGFLVLLPAIAERLNMNSAVLSSSNDHQYILGLLSAGAMVVVRFVGFVAFMLLIGARVLPWLLERIAATGSRELLTVAIVAAAIGIGLGAAELFGLSFALGAFFAGLVIGQSNHGHRASTELEPLQNAFSALFFVGMGMLFDPSILLRKPVEVLIVVAIIVIGKSVAAFLIVLALRHPISTALVLAASLAQIGEFSLILADISAGLHLLPAEGESLIVAGALFSITLNSFLLRGAIQMQERRLERQSTTA